MVGGEWVFPTMGDAEDRLQVCNPVTSPRGLPPGSDADLQEMEAVRTRLRDSHASMRGASLHSTVEVRHDPGSA